MNWIDLQANLNAIGQSISSPAGRKILEDEPALDRLLDQVRAMATDHPGAYSGFRQGALEGLLSLAVNQDRQMDVRPLARLGFDQRSDTAPRRAWRKILGLELFMALDEFSRSYLPWQRKFVIDLGTRFDLPQIAEAWTKNPVKVRALVGALRNQRGRQDGVAQALGVPGARVIWRKE